MKFERQNIIVKLGEDGPEQAILTFQEPLENERFKTVEFAKKKSIHKAKQLVFSNCIAVQNMFVGDKEVTVDDIRSGNIQGSAADQVVLAYWLALTPKDEAEEKKV